MRISLKELMDMMGVGEIPGPYQAFPWSCYDADKAVTCSAEVRMGPDEDEVESEIQMMYDDPPEGTPPVEQTCYMKAGHSQDGQWSVTILRIRGEPFGADIYNWEEKSCHFFAAVVRSLQAEEIPDIDELIEEAFHSERLADQYGGGGGKSPKIKPGQLLDMKQKGGF